MNKENISLTEEQLAAQLKQWFNTVDFKKIHFLSRNIVAKTMKEELMKLGRWQGRAKDTKEILDKRVNKAIEKAIQEFDDEKERDAEINSDETFMLLYNLPRRDKNGDRIYYKGITDY